MLRQCDKGGEVELFGTDAGVDADGLDLVGTEPGLEAVAQGLAALAEGLTHQLLQDLLIDRVFPRRMRAQLLGQRDMQAVGQEGDEDVRLNARFVLVIDRPDRQISLEVLERLFYIPSITPL